MQNRCLDFLIRRPEVEGEFIKSGGGSQSSGCGTHECSAETHLLSSTLGVCFSFAAKPLNALNVRLWV